MKQRKAKGEDAENTKTTDTPHRELSFFFFFLIENFLNRENHMFKTITTAMECAWGITSSFK